MPTAILEGMLYQDTRVMQMVETQLTVVCMLSAHIEHEMISFGSGNAGNGGFSGSGAAYGGNA